MAVSHVWNVTQLIQKNDGSGTVNIAVFTVTSTDDVTTTSNVTARRVVFEDTIDGEVLTENPGFIEYANLTEADVMGWIQADLGASRIARIESINESAIARKDTPPVAPVIVESLPW